MDILIPEEQFEELKDRDLFLACLENLGVDNWQGYSEAWQLYHEIKEEGE